MLGYASVYTRRQPRDLDLHSNRLTTASFLAGNGTLAGVTRPSEDRLSQAYDFAAANAGVGGKDDAQRVDGGVVMLGQVDLATDGAEK